jgi:two-component system, OmpR family, sensor histidine kinase MtrB
MMRHPLRRRLGLKDRVAVGFGVMALFLAVLLAVATWLLASAYVRGQQEESALAQASDHALLLKARLGKGEDTAALVEGLHYPEDGGALLVYRGARYRGTTSSEAAVPESLVRQVTTEQGSAIRVRTEDGAYLAVGIPLGDGNAFFELFPLADLSRTLRALWVILVVSAAATTLVGFAAARVVSRRLLQPVREVTAAAAAIAEGDLSARLDPEVDPDLAELAASFNRTARALQRRVQADARFAGDVSHELRTPLTTMINAMESLQHRSRAIPEDAREPLDLLAHELTRFRHLVIDLLEISRADSGDEGVREPIQIGELVRRAADGAAGRSVTTVLPGARSAEVLVDRRRLAHVVGNLVANAELHGGGCTGVLVDVVDEDIEVCVDDAGPGVPVENRERIFERFAREGGQDEQGFGLGLAIVARHVAWHGGSVRVVDSPAGGARFALRIPATTLQGPAEVPRPVDPTRPRVRRAVGSPR